MNHAGTLHYLYQPRAEQPVDVPVAWASVQQFLADETACRFLWDMLSTQFRTRAKFLAIWPSVRFVALHRNTTGQPDALLLVSTPLNWQIDYVVVHPDARRQGLAAALVRTALNEAWRAQVPYVMLSSRADLRPLYETECGFRVVAED
ncbi:MAG TPA: GNAT family N-acetyltransferase [Gemmatales bacterium]|nr:GNAT family N-acetyltransferase [Gemmatales bacterium]